MKTKMFKISEVLNWIPQKEISPFDIKELQVDDGSKYPFYGQSTTNNGIITFLSLKENVLNNKDGKPTILIHSNNQNIVYLQSPFYLKDGHGATSVLQADFLNEKIALYLITAIKKVIQKKFEYNDKATKIALKNTYIELPVDNSNNIDYDFMENYIQKIEKCYRDMIDSCIKDYAKENVPKIKKEKLIKQIVDSCKEYKISDIFYPQNGDTDIQQNHINGKGTYVISSGEKNYGILGKTDIRAKILPSNTITVDMFGATKYRNFKYKLVTHARVFSLIPKGFAMNEKIGLFLTTQMNFFRKIFSYDNMCSWDKIKNMLLYIPSKDNKFNYELMEQYILAVEEELLKDFVL